jgi:UDP-N-acetylglucosamine:LPS N-acetylglucosamine transferase
MGKKTSVLYLQHADALGGSVVSLRELVVDALNGGYECIVVCPNEVISRIYREIGAKTYVSTVVRAHHNTVYFYRFSPLGFLRFIWAILKTALSIIKLGRIIREVRPDIIHLNSSTLILYCIYFRLLQIPVVIHIRENVVNGYFGIRKNLIRKIANTFAAAIIYISEFEFEILKTMPEKSFVIYNYVHEKSFQADVGPKLPGNKLTLVTLGGLFSIKGGNIILRAMAQLGEDVELLLLGCDDPRVHAQEILSSESKAYLQELLELLHDERVGKKVRFEGKVKNPAYFIGMADALIFWATSPHFPRPVFEAWLLKIPVLYFNPLFKNPIINDTNTFIVKEGSPEGLAQSIVQMQASLIFTEKGREKGYDLARKNFTELNFEKIKTVYKSCLNGQAN